MKTIALFLFSVLLTSVSLTGQSLQDFEIYNKPVKELFKPFADNKIPDHLDEQFFIDRDVDDLWRKDSTINYSFVNDLDSSAWLKTKLTYDDQNNTLDRITIRKSTQSDEWLNAHRERYTFNDQNLQIQYISFEWKLEQWVNSRRSDYSYNDNNLRTQYTNYNWEEEQWVGDRKTEITFNNNGNRILEISYDWDVISESWLNSTKVESDFNEQGLRYRLLRYTNDMETNEWVFSMKDSTSYNEQGQMLFMYRYYWNDSTYLWDNYERLTYTYETDILSFWREYWVDNEWKYFDKHESLIDSLIEIHNRYKYVDDSIWFHNNIAYVEFNNFGKLVSWESYKRYEGNTEWYAEDKYNKSYNEIGNQTTLIYFKWDNSSEEWIGDSKHINVYNEDNIAYYNCSYYWEENGWYKETSDISYFNISSIKDLDNSHTLVQVYPNPCSNQITIDLENTDNNKVIYSIYSMSGKIVKNGILKSNSTINIDMLDKGYYLIKIDIGSKIYSAKFLKL